MSKQTSVHRDRYNQPIERGTYRITSPGFKPYIGFIYFSDQSVWIVENREQHIGSTKRFRTLVSIPHKTEFVRLNTEGEEMEPARDGYERTALIDELSKLEQLAFAAKAELRRVELLACQLMGCESGDCSQISEAAFDLAFNSKSAESVLKTFHEYCNRVEDAR